jgi:dTDP-4-amino-4,6-dideoxygalactose transaminase
MIDATEDALKQVTGAKYCVLVSSGTAALHLAAMAAGFGVGDEVIVSSITFAASANCILYVGARPVFADICPDTYNIDPQDVARKITDKTKAVIAVDFTGQVVQMNELRALCREHGLLLIEDAAHSIGSTYQGEKVGNLADMTTFSFHPVKTVTGGEGGAITTNDQTLYQKLLRLRTHGITKNPALMRRPGTDPIKTNSNLMPQPNTDPNKTNSNLMPQPSIDPWYHEQIDLGFNYRITDIQAALLKSQLDKLPMFAARRAQIVAQYDEAFAKLPELFIQREIPESTTVRHLYILRLKLDQLSCTRREFFDALCAEGIHPQVHYIPVYWHPYYEDLGYKKELCPNAESYYREVMSLPLYYALSDQDVNDCISAVTKLVSYFRLNAIQKVSDALTDIWHESIRNGTDKLSMEDIDEEIAMTRRERR